ncbi:Zinc finger C2H2-type [Cinara cedri]|uniref:Zinc finger C2H2-type n=1 Tax=Cinara cedri TaxID=506608 RepID=A0A5E4NP34_9HEMI|nr:Zinc finger C2H2-type [Cinara cedri]
MEWNISKRDMMEAGPSNGSINPSEKKEIQKAEIQKTENPKNEKSPENDDSYGCSTDYVALWTCKLCYSCILHISHIAVHVKDCQKRHKKKHPLVDELSYMCNFCGIIYKRFDLMQQHLKQKHGKPAKKDKEVQASDPLAEKLSKLSVKK